MPFSEWPLRPELLAALHAQGFTDPTSVQEMAFPAVMEGRDIIVQSRTGSGKTLAFGLPVLQRITSGSGPVEVLVVLPTRELAAQVAGVLGRMGQILSIGVVTVAGGGSYRDQLRGLAGGARIVVGTPGRLVDLIERKGLDLKATRTLVLDEADEMLDMGFAEDLEKITAALPADRQTLLFSATLPPETRALSERTLREPRTISVSTGLTTAEEIHHAAYEVFREHKLDALVQILHVEAPGLALVFCHTKVETETVAERLIDEGFECAFLHGDLAQAERNRTLNAFRRRQIRVLVATDVAARGIDVKGVSHVFNLGVTAQAETYVHRVGRTGRAGQTGTAITLVAPAEMARFQRTVGKASIRLDLRGLPQGDEVRAGLRARFREGLEEAIPTVEPRTRSLAQELLTDLGAEDVVAALLQGLPAVQAIFEAGRDIPVPRTRRAPQPRAQEQGRGFDGPRGFDGGRGPDGPRGTDGGGGGPDGRRRLADWQDPSMERIWLGIGRDHGLTPARLVAAVTQSARVQREVLGAIAIHPFFTFFDVRDDVAEHVLDVVRGFSWDGRPVKANPVPRIGSRTGQVPPEGAGGGSHQPPRRRRE